MSPARHYFMSGLCHAWYIIVPLMSHLRLIFSSNDKKYTAGAWSPTRPSIIFLGTNEGNVEVWDLLEKTHEASVIQNISTGIVPNFLHFSCNTISTDCMRQSDRINSSLNNNSPDNTAYTVGCIIENEFDSCIRFCWYSTHSRNSMELQISNSQ